MRLPPQFLDELRARTPLAALVGRVVRLAREGRHHKGLCPFHAERHASFAVYDNGYHCFGCGAHGDAIEFVCATQNATFIDAVRALAQQAGMDLPAGLPRGAVQLAAPRGIEPLTDPRQDDGAADRQRAALRLFLEAHEGLLDTPVDSYLKARGVDLRRLGRQSRSLRFHPACYCTEAEARLPALIAAITDAEGRHVASHRTWLAQHGGIWRKANLIDAKKTLGSPRGGTVRLWRGASGRRLSEAPEGSIVAIAEGIETALSVAIAAPELRVLAAVSLQNMSTIVLPDSIAGVILAGDNDGQKPGARDGLQRAINHFCAAGLDVRLARSPRGKDFNDCVRA